ncbi:hypothetical protein F4803DRAFT_549344 [Xylaria telfairii]|nr:hypothetical protein F4803DRAFT_549344 [Xylaria telfairii]
MTSGTVSPPAVEPVIDAATDIDHRCEYHVRDLGTRSVTLFPTRAHVVRDIKNVPLKVGTNQIAVIGLTPTLDENSIKIDGTGYALITNIVLELLPNRDIFDNIFVESDDADDKSDDSDTDSSEEDDDDPELKAVSDKIRQLEYESKAALEAVRGAQSRLNILEAYGQSMASGNKYHPLTPFEDGMKIYRNQRAEIFSDHREGETKVENMQKEMLTLKKLEDRLRKRAAKHRAKARVARGKEIEKQRRKDLEQVKERERVRKERELYWPKKVYVITVNIDVKATIDDDEGLIHDGVDMKTCDLTLSYATSHAFWSPTYDMSLSTTANSSGVLYFDARLTNQTSETWDKCSIALSTSQAEFSRLSELIPTLVPWNISLTQKLISGNPGIMYSNDEMRSRGLSVKEQNTRFQRHELFGVERSMLLRKTQTSLAPSPSRNALPEQQRPGLFGPARPVWNQAPTGSLFGNQASTGGLFGNQAPTGGLFAPATVGAGLFASASRSSGFGAFGQSQAFGQPQAQNTSGVQAQRPLDAEVTESLEKAVSDTDDCPTPAPLQPDLEFEESSFEETGLTTTYALVGLKSLAPSSTTSRHRVARMAFSDVVFSHVVVPKHKRSVFLKAKVRNTSKLTLPKSKTGLTLDGSFLGRVVLPRCSAGDTFTLSLGIDPSIQVLYPKPAAMHTASSLFFPAKQDNTLFTRTITLVNSRDESRGKPVQITVLDQIPVSQDERLTITPVKPAGLVADGPSVSAGDDMDNNTSWGKAEAKLKQGGEVEWAATVNPGCTVKLSLSYLCALPTGAQATNT